MAELFEKTKKAQSEERKKDDSPQQEHDVIVGAKIKIAEKTKKRRFRRNMILGSVGFIVFISMAIYFLSPASKAPFQFGVCKVFLEMKVPYPDTLRFHMYYYSGNIVKTGYTYRDNFGHIRYKNAECMFEFEPVFKLTKVNIDYDQIVYEPEDLESFNASIPAFRNFEMDLTPPRFWFRLPSNPAYLER